MTQVIFEDEKLEVLHVAEASKGHIRIFPKPRVSLSDQLSDEDFGRLMMAGNYCAAVLFELLGAHGTNMILTEGEEFCINVIERNQNDGLELMWKPKPADQSELDNVKKAISDRMMPGKEEKAQSIQKAPDIKEEITSEKGATNYLLRSLDKIP